MVRAGDTRGLVKLPLDGTVHAFHAQQHDANLLPIKCTFTNIIYVTTYRYPYICIYTTLIYHLSLSTCIQTDQGTTQIIEFCACVQYCSLYY